MQTFSNIYYSTCHDYYAIIVTLSKQYPLFLLWSLTWAPHDLNFHSSKNSPWHSNHDCSISWTYSHMLKSTSCSRRTQKCNLPLGNVYFFSGCCFHQVLRHSSEQKSFFPNLGFLSILLPQNLHLLGTFSSLKVVFTCSTSPARPCVLQKYLTFCKSSITSTF